MLLGTLTLPRLDWLNLAEQKPSGFSEAEREEKALVSPPVLAFASGRMFERIAVSLETSV